MKDPARDAQMSVSQNDNVSLTGQPGLAAAEIVSIGKTTPASSHQAQHEDNILQETVFHSAFSRTQANEWSTEALLRHQMQDCHVHRADDGVRDSDAAATALRPHITASWTSLLEVTSQSDSRLQFLPSVTNVPADKPYDSVATTLANSMPRGQHRATDTLCRGRTPQRGVCVQPQDRRVQRLDRLQGWPRACPCSVRQRTRASGDGCSGGRVAARIGGPVGRAEPQRGHILEGRVLPGGGAASDTSALAGRRTAACPLSVLRRAPSSGRTRFGCWGPSPRRVPCDAVQALRGRP